MGILLNDACGPCKNKGHECIDQSGPNAYSCVACSNSKIQCNPLNKFAVACKAKHDTQDDEIAEKKATNNATRAAKKQAGKKPQDASKAPKAQGELSKGRLKKRNMPDTVNDNTAALEALHIYLVGEIKKIQHDILDLCDVVVAQQSAHKPNQLDFWLQGHQALGRSMLGFRDIAYAEMHWDPGTGLGWGPQLTHLLQAGW
ncbi:hypothetical protein EI94DRAFT_1699910 [Lactarius quietus]|nr:hypothetical protein EI94DRAFT_1699910 [Lactarius quietus]